MKTVFFLLAFCYSTFAWSHPVIYKDGWVYWAQLAPHFNRQRVSYTFHHKAAIEVNSEHFDNVKNYRDYKLGFNYLLKRWYLEDSQGNIYLATHTGYFEQDLDKGFTWHYQLEADWESRSLYTALNAAFFNFAGNHFGKYSYRAGIAPYKGRINELQSWLVFQFDYFSASDRRLKFTPMMRFFYKNSLWEMGANLQGEFFTSLMIHY